MSTNTSDVIQDVYYGREGAKRINAKTSEGRITAARETVCTVTGTTRVCCIPLVAARTAHLMSGCNSLSHTRLGAAAIVHEQGGNGESRKRCIGRRYRAEHGKCVLHTCCRVRECACHVSEPLHNELEGRDRLFRGASKWGWAEARGSWFAYAYDDL